MKVSGDWMTGQGTQALCAVLSAGGHQALFVGGCVRNALLGEAVADIDLSTDALPLRVTELCQAAGFRVIPTGMDHGTVTVVAGGVAHEVTTFRRDVETDGRRAVVAFTDDIAQDAMRRDLTMNALYARADGTVVDPLDGLPDLLARRVRFVGDAGERIAEDALRILRFFRFHAWYGDPGEGLDAEGLAACAAGVDLLDGLSRERVGHELAKLLTAPDPAPSVAAMAQTGVLARILPGSDPRALAPLVHLEDGVGPDWRRRLAVLALSVDWGDALRLSKQDAARLVTLAQAVQSGEAPAILAWRHGSELARDALLVQSALMGQELPQNWQDSLTQGMAAHFPIKAADLMPEFQGAALGRQLKHLESAWLDSGFALDRAQLLALSRGDAQNRS
ncbi:CCA tRNA nucleotidyltransferase [Neogemmobacter tilapiae]|uniref:Poly(A) polymerase n=1 Tax=Neogemmobacter tilapiae TaxID=875041 RepID=A0A918TJA0_9RHOB|nr:CCA tRNA nucleotidyltransferase [Gemmobacter tilapiae]GHC50533.1 poly(A) polymerase [Gemmobacter tilapiae]